MKNFIKGFGRSFTILFIAILAFGAYYYVDGDWTDQGPTEGGPGGIYATWTDIDSLVASPTYSAWTTALSLCDGQSQNDAEKYLTATVYYNAGANDTIRPIIQARRYSDNLITNVDTLGRIAGATTPVAVDYKVSLSGYGRQYRVKIEPCMAGDGTNNAASNDVEISFYCSKMDPIYDKKKYTDKWGSGGHSGSKFEPRQAPDIY